MGQEMSSLYNRLEEKTLSEHDLRSYDYPKPDRSDPTMREALGHHGRPLDLQTEFASSYDCHRCGQNYKVDKHGRSLAEYGDCLMHPIRNPCQIAPCVMGYRCCGNTAGHPGCTRNPYHVHKGQPLIENFQGYVETRPRPHWDKSLHHVYSVNCKTCYTVYGQELATVALVDGHNKVIYNRLVKPTSIVLDYDYAYTGLTEHDMEHVTTTLADVQRDLLQFIWAETILIGYRIENDLNSLKLFHRRVVDITRLYPHRRGPPYKLSLKRLARQHLRLWGDDASGDPRDCVEDAIIAMHLAKKSVGWEY